MVNVGIMIYLCEKVETHHSLSVVNVGIMIYLCEKVEGGRRNGV